ncbi:hypothetical protein Are01nite_69550 [Actinoplanes regularis]|nr:hypothetical protein Are01nite_69550 [Actinoplanes regularis]
MLEQDQPVPERDRRGWSTHHRDWACVVHLKALRIEHVAARCVREAAALMPHRLVRPVEDRVAEWAGIALRECAVAADHAK